MTEAGLQNTRTDGAIAAPVREVFVFQLWGIGDMIWTTPALAVLRKRLSGIPLTVVAHSNAEAQVIRGSHLCDEVVTVGRSWKRLLALFGLAVRSRFRHAKLALLAPGMSARLAQGLRRIGRFDYVVGGTFSPRPPGYTHWTHLTPDAHYVELNLAVLRQLYPDAAEEPIYFHIDATAEEHAARWWKENGLTGRAVVGIHPGAGGIEGADKRFPLEKVSYTVHRLHNRCRDLQVLIYLGPDERDLENSFVGLGPHVRVVSNMPLRATAAVIRRTRVHVGGDTGLGHLGAAVGVPVLSLFGPTVPERLRPWGERCAILKADRDVAPDCMPCYETPLYGRCPIGQRCMNVIDYDRVVDSIEAAARSSAGREASRDSELLPPLSAGH